METELCDECNDGIYQDTCSYCNGSGEGMYDGSTCHACKGLGTVFEYCDCERGQERLIEEEY